MAFCTRLPDARAARTRAQKYFHSRVGAPSPSRVASAAREPLRDPWLGETDRCGRSRQEVRGGENREAPPRLAIGASPMG